MKTLNRRVVLRGMGGAALALPFLDIMMPARPARAQGGAAGITKLGKNGRPKKFLMVYTPSGQGYGWWDNKTAADGSLTTLGDVMSPMERHKKDIIILSGIGMLTAEKDPGAGDPGHEIPAMHATTAAFMVGGLGGGISIDQEIAKNIAGDTRFPSLQLGVHANNGKAQTPFSLSGPRKNLPAENDPQKVFKNLFTDFQTDPAVFARMNAQRKSILDRVGASYGKFIKRLGADDAYRVQSHLDGIRELEKRLMNMPTVSADVCSKPAMPVSSGAGRNTDAYITVGQMQADLVAMAFACDLTRVASIAWRMGDGGVVLPGAWPGDLHDNISHGPTPGRNIASKWHLGYFAGILDKFKAAKDGAGGSVFDNMLFYYTSEHGAGNHSFYPSPTLVAGSAGGYFKTGQQRHCGGDPRRDCGKGCSVGGTPGLGHGDLFVSFLNAMGVPATTFGHPEFCKGPVPGLVA